MKRVAYGWTLRKDLELFQSNSFLLNLFINMKKYVAYFLSRTSVFFSRHKLSNKVQMTTLKFKLDFSLRVNYQPRYDQCPFLIIRKDNANSTEKIVLPTVQV